jgi:hypothetical protein
MSNKPHVRSLRRARDLLRRMVSELQPKLPRIVTPLASDRSRGQPRGSNQVFKIHNSKLTTTGPPRKQQARRHPFEVSTYNPDAHTAYTGEGRGEGQSQCHAHSH